MARLIPLIGAAIVALVLGGGAGWYFGNVSAPKTVIVAEEPPHVTEYAIKDRVVNLADQGGRRYLKVSMVLVVAESKNKAHAADGGDAEGSIIFTGWVQSDGTVEATASGGAPKAPELPNQAQVYDAINTVLSAKRSDDLLTTDGKERLREELRAKINTVMPAGQQVTKILFTDFLLQ